MQIEEGHFSAFSIASFLNKETRSQNEKNGLSRNFDGLLFLRGNAIGNFTQKRF